MLNFLSSHVAISEVLSPAGGNISTWVYPGHFKRMNVSSVGTSSTPWRCAPSTLPSQPLLKPLFQLDVLFCSFLSYTATMSPRGQMDFFVIFTLHPQRGVSHNSITGPLQRVEMTSGSLRVYRTLRAQIVSSPPPIPLGLRQPFLLPSIPFMASALF